MYVIIIIKIKMLVDEIELDVWNCGRKSHI
jgi:hypothetical protein